MFASDPVWCWKSACRFEWTLLAYIRQPEMLATPRPEVIVRLDVDEMRLCILRCGADLLRTHVVIGGPLLECGGVRVTDVMVLRTALARKRSERPQILSGGDFECCVLICGGAGKSRPGASLVGNCLLAYEDRVRRC